MLSLSEKAVDAIRQVMTDDAEASGLRIMVQSGGCAGLQYKMGLETAPTDGDEVLEFDGVKVFVDTDSSTMLDGVMVDFVEEVAGAGFVFENPNAQGKCSCGKSFSAADGC